MTDDGYCVLSLTIGANYWRDIFDEPLGNDFMNFNLDLTVFLQQIIASFI